MINLIRGTIIVTCGHIENRLRETRSRVHHVKRSNDGREDETWNGRPEFYSRCTKIYLLNRFSHIAAQIWKQGASRNLTLSLRLTRRIGESHGAEVKIETSLNGFAERQFA